MLPITRVNLDNICCTCLVDIRPTNLGNNNVYVIKEDTNLLEVLKATAYVTVLKHPRNLKFLNDYSRKLCQICFLKAQYSHNFLENVMESTARLKDLFESKLNKTGLDMKRLKYCCRICLKRQRGLTNEDNQKYLNWLKDFSNIKNDEQLNNNKDFPKQLCRICLEKLRNVEEYWLLSTYSFKYIVSEIEKDCELQDDGKAIIGSEWPQEQFMVVDEKSLYEHFIKNVILVIKFDKEGREHQEIIRLNNNVFKINSWTDVSDEVKDVVVGASTDGNNLAVEKDDDDIEYDFVIINSEETSMTS